MADPSVDSVDVFVVIKSLTVKFLSIEWHWDRIFISDYRMFPLCLSVNNVLSWNTKRIKVNRSFRRTEQVKFFGCVSECIGFGSWPQHIVSVLGYFCNFHQYVQADAGVSHLIRHDRFHHVPSCFVSTSTIRRSRRECEVIVTG